MKKRIWLFPLLLTLVGCSHIQSSPQPTVPDVLTADEYAVYGSVIQSNWPGQAQIVVADKTDFSNLTNVETLIDGNLPGLEKDTLSQFIQVNKQNYSLEDHFQIDASIILLSQTDLKAIFDQNLEDSWKRFFKKYPSSQGLLTLSRVGFNAQKDQALVYFGNSKGSVDGVGYVALLSDENNTWVLIKQISIWIS
jgi:hypothetical protein